MASEQFVVETPIRPEELRANLDEYWRRLHNFCAQWSGLVHLEEIVDGARTALRQADAAQAALTSDITQLTDRVNRTRAELASLEGERDRTMDEHTAQILAHQDEKIAEATTAIGAAKQQQELEEVKLRTLQETHQRFQEEHADAVRQATERIEYLTGQVKAKQAVLDQITAQAASIVKGGA